ncbi:MAG TPA: HU family DNA-binding protein [Alloacidobacterium sp.]|nr:HU family DNA-binding protein [Alloacidobacterium sp.]
MNKADIVKELRKRNLSRRDAVRILDFVLDEVSAALKRGEPVEFAVGTPKRVRHAHRQQEGRFLNQQTTIYKKPYTVILEVSPAGWMPPKKTTRQQERLAELWRTRPPRT